MRVSGLVLIDDKYHGPGDVMSAADLACYTAKDNGRNRGSIEQYRTVAGLKTIGEHVKTETVILLLKEMGVDYAQGHGVKKPVKI